MAEFLAKIQAGFRLVDVLDIAIIAVLLYGLLQWMRQRATFALVVALSGLAATYVVATLLNLYLTLALFQVGLTVVLVVLVLIFQDDLRRAAERLAAWRPFGSYREDGDDGSADLLAEAAQALAARKCGALIVLAGREPLDRYVRGGVPLDGRISVSLLLSLFDSDSPGHDGAAIVVDDRVTRFGTHLPLTGNLDEVDGGTRHAAALGLAEACDALVVVVSEERGSIGLAADGRLETVGAAAEIKERVSAYRRELYGAPGRLPPHRWLVANIGAKLLAISLAGLAWIAVASRVETIHRTVVVPVQYRNLPTGWALLDGAPTQARITLVGTERAFAVLDRKPPTLIVDMAAMQLGQERLQFSQENIRLPTGIVVQQIEPRTADVTVYQPRVRSIPIEVVLNEASLPPHLKLVGAVAEPKAVEVREKFTGNAVNSIATEPVDLSGATMEKTVRVKLLFPAHMEPVDAHADAIGVRIRVEARMPQSKSQ